MGFYISIHYYSEKAVSVGTAGDHLVGGCLDDGISPTPPTFNSDNGQIDMFKSQPVICVPHGAREAYAKADGWKYHADSIRESLK